MLDYKGIEALSAIIEANSFDIAARQLHITQSAISQRLQTLQNYYGDPLLIREKPYQPTSLGEGLIGIYKKVQSLELSLQKTLGKEAMVKLSIAMSRDHFETWFHQLMVDNDLLQRYIMDVTTDDQDKTIHYLKKGVVSICLSSQKHPISNCKSEFIGNMTYILVSTADFKRVHYKVKDIKKDIIKAPTLVYDKNDHLYQKYLEKHFNLVGPKMFVHTIPSVRGFKALAMKGHAQALVPIIDVLEELKKNKLINMFPEKTWDMPVYLHSWAFGSNDYNDMVRLIFEKSKTMLNMSSLSD